MESISQHTAKYVVITQNWLLLINVDWPYLLIEGLTTLYHKECVVKNLTKI